jgi:hypothetical protein
MRTSDSMECPSGLRPPNRRSCAASRPSSACTSLRTHSARWTHCAPCTGLTPSGLGLMRRGLFASVPLGSQVFYEAKAFNANIGAWNTASIANMVSVCALIAIASICEVCASCKLMCFTHFSSITMCTTDITVALSGFAPALPPQLRRISMVERQHIAPHALGPLDAASPCTRLIVRAGACTARAL